jgi:hypothetical protein
MNNFIDKPQADECSEYFYKYINKVPIGKHVFEFMQEVAADLISTLLALPAEKHNYAYADGKWTVQDLFQHLIDAERIFAYRALCIARNDKTSLPGFEENEYAKEASNCLPKLEKQIEEFKLLRESNLLFFSSLNRKSLERKGIANNKPISVQAIMFIMVGHVQHHLEVLKGRYL